MISIFRLIRRSDRTPTHWANFFCIPLQCWKVITLHIDVDFHIVICIEIKNVLCHRPLWDNENCSELKNWDPSPYMLLSFISFINYFFDGIDNCLDPVFFVVLTLPFIDRNLQSTNHNKIDYVNSTKTFHRKFHFKSHQFSKGLKQCVTIT